MKLLLSLVLITGFAHGASPAELVVAIRYLKPEGVSHSHVYLYREDGKLLRQLSKDDQGQDRDPFFSPDGESIVFTRKLKTAQEYWSVEPLGKNLHKLEQAPEWYLKAAYAPYFHYPEFEEPNADVTLPEPKFISADGETELILRMVKGDEFNEINGPGHGKNFLLRNVKTGMQYEMGAMPGFVGLASLLQLGSDSNARFLLTPSLRVAFFGLHLNSSDGDTTFAVDMNALRIINLSPNWAAPFPLPGEAAFLTFTSVRYVPIPGSTKTANCSYLEHWDSEFNCIRYATKESAAIFYGASMYRPNREPAVIYMPKDPDTRKLIP